MLRTLRQCLVHTRRGVSLASGGFWPHGCTHRHSQTHTHAHAHTHTHTGYALRQDCHPASPVVFVRVCVCVLGAIIYVNGVEGARMGMGPVSPLLSYLTSAMVSVAGTAEKTYYPLTAPVALFMTGSNTIAVEVHQGSTSTPDLGFDLSITFACKAVGAWLWSFLFHWCVTLSPSETAHMGARTHYVTRTRALSHAHTRTHTLTHKHTMEPCARSPHVLQTPSKHPCLPTPIPHAPAPRGDDVPHSACNECTAVAPHWVAQGSSRPPLRPSACTRYPHIRGILPANTTPRVLRSTCTVAPVVFVCPPLHRITPPYHHHHSSSAPM